MKRKLLILFIALLAIACNGQQSQKENVKPLTEQEALKAFKKQKHRFEIKGYKIYYNDQLMKLDSVSHFTKRVGEPAFDKGTDIVWNNFPVWGVRYSTMERFFIYFRPFFEGNQYFTENSHDPMTLPLKNMPEIDGYMLVEGHPIHKDTTPKELSEILKPIYGEHFVNLMGTPTIVFELKEEEIKEIIPHWGADKSYDKIFIGFEFIRNPKTKEVIGLKSVDYSYFLL
ncbi:hypothetical protein [Capnocytophaga gingivalis]|uniref:Lipoprotein n=1 Tax=Capnocytophaga gingivalis TaxID=1017 RepID=A0ABU5Y8Z5_9FLAO|nr:hypothetical protein [Capnocytophaga gingivalis]MEB3039449.1 hypothetical protein [Capnocytophaga gingivalis]